MNIHALKMVHATVSKFKEVIGSENKRIYPKINKIRAKVLFLDNNVCVSNINLYVLKPFFEVFSKSYDIKMTDFSLSSQTSLG